MKRLLPAICSVLFMCACYGQDMKAIYDKILPSVVVIKCVDVLGYGFFVDKDLVVTNYQVIIKAKVGAAKATTGTGSNSYDVLGFVSLNQENDLVLLKVNGSESSHVKINESPLPAGSSIYALCSKNDEEIGIKSARVRDIKDYGNHKLIQISTSVILENPGLPALNPAGEVIGIEVPSPIKDSATNFAIPAEKIAELIRNKSEMVRTIKDLIPEQTIETDKVPQKSEQTEQYLNQGNARIFAKDYKGAVDKFTLAIRISPGDPDAYVFRGQAKYLLMEYKNALEDFNKAIELQSDYAEAYDLRGIVKAELGDKEGACDDWIKSYEYGFNDAFKLLKEFCDLEKYK